MRIIDSHAHVVLPNRPTYPYQPNAGTVQPAPFGPEELLGEMSQCGVEAALLVQRSQFYGLDNALVCDAGQASAPLHAVCAANCEGKDADLAVMAWAKRGARGFRLMGSPFNGALGWLAGPGSGPLWRAIDRLGLPLCVHFFDSNRLEGLQYLAEQARAFPTVPVVVDHLTNGPKDGDGIDELVLRLMEAPQVTLKVTTIPLGRLNEEGRAGEVLGAYVRRFGSERLMWGTDITQSKGTYRELVELGLDAAKALAPEDREALFSTTCARIYDLG
jgi:predicted TIM-barrel fold metal-dependent hydrolase